MAIFPPYDYLMNQLLRFLCIGALLYTPSVYASNDVFSDETLTQNIKLPAWFKLSFLDFKDDVIDAEEANKKGIILYFGRKDCPYCKALIDNNWGDGSDISHYTKNNFDVIGINTKGQKSITDFDGFVYGEREYSLKMKTNFTPSLLFFNLQEKLVLKLSGYQRPYRFLAALEYVADGHYKDLSFASYLAQADDALESNGQEELNDQPYFDSPPYNLSRTHFKSDRPLVVFFENKYCHACDILHANPLENEGIKEQFSNFDVIQVEKDSSVPVITPDGIKQTVSEWSNKLELHYSPTIIFFDEAGKEIIRIDSVVWLNRLGRVLEYINTKSYQRYPSFQAWRASGNKD